MQARQLDLQFALVAAGTLGKDLEDQQRAVIDRQTDVALQVALLRRAQSLVKQHLFGAVHERQFLDFIGLAAAHKQGRIGGLALASQTRHGL